MPAAPTTSTGLTLVHGRIAFRDADALAIDQAGAHTAGTFTKLGGTLEHASDLSRALSFSATLRWQKALGRKNLDSSEDFALGGVGGVRAFPDGEYSAESGYVMGGELFHALPTWQGVSHKASVFVDTGYARMERPISSASGKQLSGIGLGYQASFQTLWAKVHLARVVGATRSQTEDRERTRLLLQLGLGF